MNTTVSWDTEENPQLVKTGTKSTPLKSEAEDLSHYILEHNFPSYLEHFRYVEKDWWAEQNQFNFPLREEHLEKLSSLNM